MYSSSVLPLLPPSLTLCPPLSQTHLIYTNMTGFGEERRERCIFAGVGSPGVTQQRRRRSSSSSSDSIKETRSSYDEKERRKCCD